MNADNLTPTGGLPQAARPRSVHYIRNRWILGTVALLAVLVLPVVHLLTATPGLHASRHYSAVGSTRSYTSTDTSFTAVFGAPTPPPPRVSVTLQAVLDRGVTEDLTVNTRYRTHHPFVAFRFLVTNTGSSPTGADLGDGATLVTTGGATLPALTEFDPTNAGSSFPTLGSIPAGGSLVGVVAFMVPDSAHLSSVVLHPRLAVPTTTTMTWLLR